MVILYSLLFYLKVNGLPFRLQTFSIPTLLLRSILDIAYPCTFWYTEIMQAFDTVLQQKDQRCEYRQWIIFHTFPCKDNSFYVIDLYFFIWLFQENVWIEIYVGSFLEPSIKLPYQGVRSTEIVSIFIFPLSSLSSCHILLIEGTLGSYNSYGGEGSDWESCFGTQTLA